MKFVLPDQAHERQAAEMIQEFLDHQSQTNGDGGLSYYLHNRTYSEWLDQIKKDMDIANVHADRVPQFTYFYLRETDNRIVGMIAVRLALNDFLRREGGHIGYCIRPTERKKGYATQMLRQALAFGNAIGLSDVVITCSRANTASANVIRNCGGVLDAEFFSDTFQEVIQRYHIRQTAASAW